MDRVIYVKLRGFLATFIMAFITRSLRVLWDLGDRGEAHGAAERPPDLEDDRHGRDARGRDDGRR